MKQMTEFVWDHKSWLSIYIPNGLICWNDLYLWINCTPIFITHTVCYHNSFLLFMLYLTIYTTDRWLMRAYACLSCSLLTYLRSYTDTQRWKSIKTTREISLKLHAFIGKSKNGRRISTSPSLCSLRSNKDCKGMLRLTQKKNKIV